MHRSAVLRRAMARIARGSWWARPALECGNSVVGLDGIFGPDGVLSTQLPGYRHRAAQEEMAERVAAAFGGHEHLAIEAGTGIGKTFAYLIPALVSGRRVIVSTGTRTLQDQLFARDLPLLGRALGRPVDVALLKGRSNYLCWHRLEAARSDGWQDAATLATLDALDAFGQASRRGDLGEFDDLPTDHGLRAAVTSTVDNCLGVRCAFYERCFVLKARQRAQESQIVIVNHHLLLADLALKEAGFGELLPGADMVIVDEAHLFPDIAQQFFRVSVTLGELDRLARDLALESQLAGLGEALLPVVEPLAKLVASGRRVATRCPDGTIPWPAPMPDAEALTGVWLETLAQTAENLRGFADMSVGLSRCHERCAISLAALRQIREAAPDAGMRWLQASAHSLAAHWVPLDVGASLAERIEAQNGTWVFTSATLAMQDDFSHFTRRMGLPDIATCVLPSPFDYAHNARLYLPEGLPVPGGDEHTEALLHAVWPLVLASGGGAFLLFTSYRALRAAEAFIAARSAPGPVLVQGGELPRSRLLEAFRAAGNAILLGTGSFWQGVDVRGAALRLVLIDKLPFAAPNDPMVEARLWAVRAEGGDPFFEVQLPQAVLTLKQGVGRLIRDYDDRGLVVLGDPRLRTRPYGRRMLASLPPIPLCENFADAQRFIRSCVSDESDAVESTAVVD